MRSNSEPQQLPPAMPPDQQAIEQAERDCRPHEQVHRGDAVDMIAEERLPALGWRASSPGHILGHAGLSDFDAKLKKLAMHPWRSPQRIGYAHLADQPACLRRHNRPSATRSRLPAPVRSEPGAMPTDDCLRLH